MKQQRPVTVEVVVCDICKRDILNNACYYSVRVVNPNVCTHTPDSDVCFTCFSKVTPPVMFALSASYAITSNYLPYDFK